jgi:fumarate hydratase class II
MTVTRQEKDTFGLIDVPANKLWGAQTQRSLQNFDISGEQQPREIIAALAQVKKASASVNQALGLLDEKNPEPSMRPPMRCSRASTPMSSPWWSGRPAPARRPI